jgi:gluconolactonase
MTRQEAGGGSLSRRTLVGAIAAGAAVTGSRRAMAQAEKGVPPTGVTSPPRDFGPNGAPNVYAFDPDIIIVDPLFTQYVQGNTPIQRLWTGSLWAEGPAWNGQGRYLVWSDIPNNRQLRWLDDNGQVSVFRTPSNNSNGNTFDF